MAPLLGSIVIVNWNGGAMLLDAVESALSQTIASELEIIVVDNASIDGSVESLVKKRGDAVKVVHSEQNLGFAGGNNLGFSHATGKYVLLLNNDAVAEPDWAERLLSVLESTPCVGMCTSKILFFGNRDRIDNVGHNMYPDGLNRSRGHMDRDNGRYDETEETLFASGCAAAYLRDVVTEYGGFDEEFFAYGDDADLGLKFQLAGYRCMFVPSAVVYHKGSSSVGAYSTKKIFWIERNRIWILAKYMPLSWIIASPWYTLRRMVGTWMATRRDTGLAGELARKNSTLSLALTVLRAWLAGIVGLPRMLRKRRDLARKRRISQVDFERLLRRFSATHAEMTFGDKAITESS